MEVAVVFYVAFLFGVMTKWLWYTVTTLTTSEVSEIAKEFQGAPKYIRAFVLKHGQWWHRVGFVIFVWFINSLYLTQFVRQQRSPYELLWFCVFEVVFISILGKFLDRKCRTDLQHCRAMLHCQKGMKYPEPEATST
jgi:hypothetical protein